MQVEQRHFVSFELNKEEFFAVCETLIHLKAKKLPNVTHTTKRCNECGNTNLLLLRTFHQKICTDCGNKIDWYLEKGQTYLV